MITKLKEVTAVFEKGFSETFLNDLQELGIAHLERTHTEYIEPTNKDIERIYRIKNFLKTKFTDEELENLKQEQPKSLEEILDRADHLFSDLKLLEEEKKSLDAEKEKAKAFGSITNEKLEDLKSFGINLRFYHIPRRFLDKITEDYELIYEYNDNTLLIVVFNGEELPYNEEFLPKRSYKELQSLLSAIDTKYNDLIEELYSFTRYYKFLDTEALRLLDTLDFIKVKASLQDVEDLINIVKIWVPKDSLNSLLEKLDSYGVVAYDIQTAKDSKETPVLLKNGKFATMFETVTKLFSLPNYEELDLTPFFAPFFTMFFGLCVGDAGYGVGLLIMSIFFYKKSKLIANLGVVFALSVTFWGILTGTVFGVNVFEHHVPVLSSLAVFKTVHMFYFALLVGLLQIFFGMFLRAFYALSYKGFKYSLGTFGWIILLFAVVGLYLKDKSPAEGFVIGEYVINFYKDISVYLMYPVYLGSLLILLFNDMTVPWYIRIGKGIWDLYGITGFFGDLLSYIRLFALGISSAILGTVINSLAESLLKIPIPGLREVSYFLFLFLGHFGNMLLALLGAFVHSLRLTFVEFYKNAGFEGGGKKFVRFKKNISRR